MNANLNTPNSVAQLAHIGWGAALTFALALFMPTWPAAGVASLLAFSKEFIEYRWGVWEAKTPWYDSLEDFLYFLVGIMPAILLLTWRHR